MPDPVHIAQTVTVGLIVVLPVLVHVTRHLSLSSGPTCCHDELLVGRLTAIGYDVLERWASHVERELVPRGDAGEVLGLPLPLRVHDEVLAVLAVEGTRVDNSLRGKAVHERCHLLSGYVVCGAVHGAGRIAAVGDAAGLHPVDIVDERAAVWNAGEQAGGCECGERDNQDEC